MTSRRPMTRSFSGNGRTSSFSDEEGSTANGRSESRNTYLSNVRPENSYSRYSHYRPTRSTLCSVMAQLTEDIQPSFETTLKSKAVSENCNVKFTCVVSGYPAPELKWYKDDIEMDRYCGLPKYEIRRNGKTHTLHIYNCTLDDAAIYQVSASNSKGIVSCSGVLEVGTMNEYMIHQRFFAKLKQKAEKKKKDLEEQSKKKEKEDVQREKPKVSPERPQRKRPIPQPEQIPSIKEPELLAVEQPGAAAAAEPNGVCSEVKETTPVAAIETALDKEVPPSEEMLAKKKIRITNGVDVGVSSSSKSHIMGNGGENCYDGGFSLAQFLAEAVQSQATEEKHNEEKHNSSTLEKPREMDKSLSDASKEKDMEQESKQKEREEEDKAKEKEYQRGKELSLHTEKEREKPMEMSHTTDHSKHFSEVKHYSKPHKDHDHHNIHASISSMLHSVKDFFFGKGKKDSHGVTDYRESDSDYLPTPTQPYPPQSQTPPSYRLQLQHHPEMDKPVTDELLPMETDTPKELSECVDVEQPSLSAEPLTPHKHKNEYGVLRTDPPPALKLPTESVEEPARQSAKETDAAVEAMEVSEGAENSCPGEEMSLSGLRATTEAEGKDYQLVTEANVVPLHQRDPDCLVASPQPHHLTSRDQSSPREDASEMPQTKDTHEEECPHSPTLTSVTQSSAPPDSIVPAKDSHGLCVAPTDTLQENEMSVDKVGKGGEPDMEKDCSSVKLFVEEKSEVKSNEQPCSDIDRSNMTELTRFSLEERIETRESTTPEKMASSPSSMEVQSLGRDHAEVEAKCTSLTQEMNLGLPPPGAAEMGDLKIRQKCTPTIADESKEVPKQSSIQDSNSCVRGIKEINDLKEVLISVLEKDSGDNSRKNLKLQEESVIECKHTEAGNKSLESEMEAGRKLPAKAEELNESGTVLEAQNEARITKVLEEPANVAHQDNNEKQLSKNVPQIEISLCIPDGTEFKPAVPDLSPAEHFTIPKTEIMEPNHKECPLPLTDLAHNTLESEPVFSQEHDVTEVIIQHQSGADSSELLPTQKVMENDCNLSLTKKGEDIAQLGDETEMMKPAQTSTKSSEELPRVDYASVPVISVSCTDDSKDNASLPKHTLETQQPFETPTEPLFVLPPISVTNHEIDGELGQPTQCKWTETETSAATQRGTKHCVDIKMTTKPEKTLNQEEMAKRIITESTPFIPYETPSVKVADSVPSFTITTEENIVPEILKAKPLKEAKIENSVTAEHLLRNRSSVDRLSFKPPTHPSLSPASLRKFMSKAPLDSENEAATVVPVITVDDHQSDRVDEDLSGGSTPTSSLSCESSPRLKRRDSLSLIRSATPEELASGARRKIFIQKTKEDGDGVVGAIDAQSKKESPYMSPSQARRAALLQAPMGQHTPPMERRSPLLSRRKATLEVPKAVEETPTEEPVKAGREEKPAEKKLDPLKAPQVIRKIRGEPFPDASGHLKLWCQFFNVLSDSTIKWYRDEEEILEVKRSGGDESQVALAIVLASSQDCGVYGCTIKNEYGTDTTDFLLSVDILSEILLKDDLEVGEEIEMTPLLFTKGLANCGNWGEKYFGRIMTELVHVGEGHAHKASKVKVIYGLDPIFESGSNCIIKVQNPIAYGTKQESNLVERNLEITKQECKVQNMIREYCKIFAAEARVTENFGSSLEVIPQYLMYRPANSVPYATVEADLKGDFVKLCMMDPKGRLITRTVSEVEQKCCSFQHWIHQWTHGNLLVTQLEGVEMKITNVRVATKSKGYQGLTEIGSPDVFEQFITDHQCNYYCGLLGLRPLKTTDSQPTKLKGSRSPLLNRKLSSGSSSPQLQRKGHSPQMPRKANASPKVTRKAQETEDNKSDAKIKPAETLDVLEMSYQSQQGLEN